MQFFISDCNKENLYSLNFISNFEKTFHFCLTKYLDFKIWYNFNTAPTLVPLKTCIYCTFSLLQKTKGDILKILGNQTALISWTQNHWENYVQVSNELRLNKLWQDLYFCGNYPLRVPSSCIPICLFILCP